MNLTAEQQKIANHIDGHAKVVATAGSGKSTVMAARIGNLMDAGIDSGKIMSVMFNTDAKNSFKNKLIRLYGNPAPPVFTFHGLGSNLINTLVKKGLIEKATLKTSEWDAIKIAREVLDPYFRKIEGLSRKMTVDEFLNFVDLTKSSLDGPAATFREYDFGPKYRFFIDVFKKFEAARAKLKVRFFSDLIYDPVKFLTDNPEHICLFADMYDHIIVDECQDINDIQQKMVKVIAGEKTSVMVVGDDDQCIYTWRGARPEYLVSGFDKVFKNSTTYTMSMTFRYGHQISLAANYLIKNNKKRVAKQCISAPNTPKSEISLDLEKIGQPSVPQAIQKWLHKGRKITEVAVLVRSYSQAISVELGLLRHGIAYRMEGGTPVFSSYDIGAVVAALHVATRMKAVNEKEQKNIARMFLKFPPTGVDKDHEWDIVKELNNAPQNFPSILEEALFKAKETWIKERLRNRADAWRNLSVMGGKSQMEVIEFAMQAMGINHQIEYQSSNVEQKEEAIRRFDSFKKYAEQFEGRLIDFVEHIESLRQEQEAHVNDDEALLITSLHRSKGCEWPFVIMPNLVQGKFPLFRNGDDSPEVIEDERRLFFTGITRAQEHLKLIAPRDPQLERYLSAGADFTPQTLSVGEATASQFVYESNIFVSQRADYMAQGKQPEVAVKSPSTANTYIQKIGGKPVLKEAV